MVIAKQSWLQKHTKKQMQIISIYKKALSPEILIVSFKTALFVGFILNLINHGQDILYAVDISWASIFFNFAIPFCVSAYSGARASLNNCEYLTESTNR